MVICLPNKQILAIVVWNDFRLCIRRFELLLSKVGIQSDDIKSGRSECILGMS